MSEAPSHPPQGHAAGLSASIRKEAVWAAIAAALMLYFGFTFQVAEDSFSPRLLLLTLRYGGFAMLLSAGLLALGTPIALMFDGIFAMLIGAGLALAAILWLAQARSFEVVTVLELVFGYLFLSSGLRNFREFCRLGEPPESE